MALKDTTLKMKKFLELICCDLEKAEDGNKTAAQRVRTATIELEKLAKQYRKESVASERKVSHTSKKPIAAKTQKAVVIAKPLKRATAKLPTKKR